MKITLGRIQTPVQPGSARVQPKGPNSFWRGPNAKKIHFFSSTAIGVILKVKTWGGPCGCPSMSPPLTDRSRGKIYD